MTSMVAVQIVGIRLDPHTGMSAVLLGESDQMTRVLPIMIGLTEAQSIARFLTGSVNSRPCTHDLATTLMAVAGSRLEEVVVTELRDGVFFAELFIEAGDGMKSLSARSSDGIALAVRVGAPIYVRSTVLDDAAVAIEYTPEAPRSDEEIEQVVSDFQAFLESTTAKDFEAEHCSNEVGRGV